MFICFLAAPKAPKLEAGDEQLYHQVKTWWFFAFLRTKATITFSTKTTCAIFDAGMVLNIYAPCISIMLCAGKSPLKQKNHYQ